MTDVCVFSVRCSRCVACCCNLEPRREAVNGPAAHGCSLVYIAGQIDALEWNKMNPEIERTPSLPSHGGPRAHSPPA